MFQETCQVLIFVSKSWKNSIFCKEKSKVSKKYVSEYKKYVFIHNIYAIGSHIHLLQTYMSQILT